MLVALGIILRGTGFALRSTRTGRLRPLLSTTFAASSLVTPWFLGTFAGAVASGRVPGDPSTSWLHPVSLAGGTLAVACCAYLGAVYICGEADRVHQADLAADFRLRALLASAACASATLVGAVILHLDAPQLFHGFTHRALPISLLSALAALVSIGLLVARRYRSARVAAAIGVAAVLWAWGIAQWPYMVPPTLTVAGAAAATPTLDALIVTAAVGSVLLLPALACLFVLKGRGLLREPDTENPLAPVTTSSPDL
jgi:cytochrome d ubiquinol oxidase subunit II